VHVFFFYSGGKVVTSSRRVATTLLGGSTEINSNDSKSNNNTFKNSTIVPAPATMMPRSVWAKPQKSMNINDIGMNRCVFICSVEYT